MLTLRNLDDDCLLSCVKMRDVITPIIPITGKITLSMGE